MTVSHALLHFLAPHTKLHVLLIFLSEKKIKLQEIIF